MATPPLIFIHGAFCGGWCFDGFRERFEAAGHLTRAPDLPGHAAGDPPSRVKAKSLADYARAVCDVIDGAPERPVLIGHSMGGLVAQLAAVRRRVAGLILLAPSPAWGQPVTSPVELGASVALMATRGPYWLEAVEPDWPTARAFTFDKLSPEAARAAHARMKPESGRALFEIVNWWLDPTLGSFVAPIAMSQPSLVIAGGRDQVHSPATVQVTAQRLAADFRTIPDASHWMMAETDAPALADACLDWLDWL
jgi:pimeloyl-ACP methyl ester carboxylesterase